VASALSERRLSPLVAFAFAVTGCTLYLIVVGRVAPHPAHLVLLGFASAAWQFFSTQAVPVSTARRTLQVMVSAVLAPYLAMAALVLLWFLSEGQM